MNYLLAFATIFAAWSLFQSARRWNRRRQATNSPAVKAAVDYWTGRLRPHSKEPTETAREQFRRHLYASLVEAYVATGNFADIGIFYYAPHQYGVDDIIQAALYSTGLVSVINRDISYHHFAGEGRTHISLTRSWITSGSEEHDIWTEGTAERAAIAA